MSDRVKIRPSRRDFLAVSAASVGASSVVAGFPSIVPASVLGATAPGNRINIGAIGIGRISRVHDLPGLWKHDARADHGGLRPRQRARVEDAKMLVNGHYAKETGKPYDGVTGYSDYRELLANERHRRRRHQHARITGTRSSPSTPCEAGKDVYLQKPASLTIAEGRALSNAVHRSGRIFQIGSQQRSSPQFRYAAELVRNGRIGELKTVEVGLPGDPSGDDEPVMPVPKNFELRGVARLDAGRALHREARASAEGLRPPRLAAVRTVRRRHDHRLGRASHRQRALGHGRASTPGPIEVWGSAEFPAKGLWDVHGSFKTEARLRERRHDDRQRRFPERHQVHRHRGLDLRLARQRGGHSQRSGGPAEGQPGAGREQSGDPRLR